MLSFRLFLKENIPFFTKEGITICQVRDERKGQELAYKILLEVVDKHSVVFLSGGNTPKTLYRCIASQQELILGAAGLVDERFGEKGHKDSNEKMLQETGLLDYIISRDVPFHPILTHNAPIEDAAATYDAAVRRLLFNFPKSIAVLGIGLDGHTAGILGNRVDFINPLFSQENKDAVVGWFTDPKGQFKERVTMTFLGLSLVDVLFVLVFGDDKKKALEKIFDQGSEEEVPGRFYKRKNIAEKTLLITDQAVE